MNGILADSDFIIALFFKNESTHSRAQKLYEKHKTSSFYVINLVPYEVATVVSRKYKQSVAIEVSYDIAHSFPVVAYIDQEHEKLVWQEFRAQKNKNISVVDCANKITAHKHGFTIASFDSFYPKELIAT